MAITTGLGVLMAASVADPVVVSRAPAGLGGGAEVVYITEAIKARGDTVSTMNPSITVDATGRVVLIAQANIATYKNQQRPMTTIVMVSSTTNGRTWSNVTQMGPPGAPQAAYSPSSGTLFLFAKSANMLDNGTRPELPDTCWMSASARPGDPAAWSPAVPMNVQGCAMRPPRVLPASPTLLVLTSPSSSSCAR